MGKQAALPIAATMAHKWGAERADSPDSAPPHLCRGYPLIVSRREYGKRSSAYDALYLEATVSGPVAFGGVARSASAAAQRKSR